MKGLKLEAGQVVVLALDGTMVYVEGVSPGLFVAVVALPEQPTERADDRVFTPGRVGAKKISPFSEADKVIPVADLSERNKNFIGTFEALRTQHGPNYVDRTPEEQAAWDLKANPPDKSAAKAARRAEKEAKKSAKVKGPRSLQRCVFDVDGKPCGQERAHICHPGQHEFTPPAAPVAPCVACGLLEGDAVHAKDVVDGGHKFISPEAVKAPRQPREPREAKVKTDKPEKERKERQPKTTLPQGKHRWATDGDHPHQHGRVAERLKMLCAVNGKYNDGNSGAAIIAAIQAAGEAGAEPVDVCVAMAAHPRWCGVPIERVQLAFQQLLGAQLLEAVK